MSQKDGRITESIYKKANADLREQLAEARRKALGDTAIADMVRRKLRSGNIIPVDRCMVMAEEVRALIDQPA